MALQRRDGVATFSVAWFLSFQGTARARRPHSAIVSKLSPDAGLAWPWPRRADLLELDCRSTRLQDLARD